MIFYHFFVGLFEAGRDPESQNDPDSYHNKAESESETLYTGTTLQTGKLMLPVQCRLKLGVDASCIVYGGE